MFFCITSRSLEWLESNCIPLHFRSDKKQNKKWLERLKKPRMHYMRAKVEKTKKGLHEGFPSPLTRSIVRGLWIHDMRNDDQRARILLPSFVKSTSMFLHQNRVRPTLNFSGVRIIIVTVNGMISPAVNWNSLLHPDLSICYHHQFLRRELLCSSSTWW